MTETSLPRRRHGQHLVPGSRLLRAAALVIGGLLALPVITIIYLAAAPAENIWPHLVATVLPGYIWQTALLLAGVGAITFVVGTAVAWLVTACSFPLRRVFQWARSCPWRCRATSSHILTSTC